MPAAVATTMMETETVVTSELSSLHDASTHQLERSSQDGEEDRSMTTSSGNHHDYKLLMPSSADDHLFGRAKEMRVLQHAMDNLFKDFERNEGGAFQESRTKDSDGVAVRRASREETSPSEEFQDRPFIHHQLKTIRTLVLISGLSGCGKSALAMHFEQQCLDRHGFFVSGKFDLQQMDEPFAGIKTALLQLCQQILSLPRVNDSRDNSDAAMLHAKAGPGPDPRLFAELQDLLLRDLSTEELQILSNFIPNILDVINVSKSPPTSSSIDIETTNKNTVKTYQDENASTSSSSFSSTKITTRGNGAIKKNQGGGYKQKSDGLKFVLKRLIQTICNYCPLIILADDIQWADQSTLDLLQSWIMDSNNSALMIIGCYRSNIVERSDHETTLPPCEEGGKATADNVKAGIHPVQRTIQLLEESKRERCFRIVRVAVEEFQEHDVAELLSSLLHASKPTSSTVATIQDHDHHAGTDSSTSSPPIDRLAHLVHQKTNGNPFFVQQYIQSLVENQVLTLDRSTMAWKWDVETIQLRSPQTVTSMDMMTARLRQSQQARFVLPVAACLGATFSKATLSSVVRALSMHSDHSQFFCKIFDMPVRTALISLSEINIQDAIRRCQRDGFIAVPHEWNAKYNLVDRRVEDETNTRRPRRRKHKNDQGLCKFTHDRIQEAALALVPQHLLSELRYRVGEVLLAALTPEQVDAKVFAIATLLNTRPDLVPTHADKIQRRRRIINLNYKAGIKAMECSAFHSALEYLQVAIRLLPQKHWSSDFQLSIDLYSAAAECAFVIPDHDLMHEYCTAIINLDCPVLYKMRAYHILMPPIPIETANWRISDHVERGFSVLDQLGCNLPKTNTGRIFKGLLGLIKLKFQASKWDESTFRDLPVSSSVEDAAVAKTLLKFSTQLYFMKPEVMPVCVVKNFRWMLKAGITPYSPPAVAGIALVMAAHLHNFQAAELLGERALEMLGKLDTKESESRTVMLIYTCVFHWMKPMEGCIAPLQFGYRSGMASGDVESAMWSLHLGCEMQFICGKPLMLVEQRSDSNSKIMKDQKEHNFERMALMRRQSVLNLQGTASTHTHHLVGDVFDETQYDIDDAANNSKSQNHSKDDVYFALATRETKAAIACFFSRYTVGADIIITDGLDHIMEVFSAQPVLYLYVFVGGLNCYASYQQQPKRRNNEHVKMAKRCRRMIKQWYKQGSPNCEHSVAILDAEEYWRRGDHDDAIQVYHKAIAICEKQSYIHFQALSNERLGMLLYGCNGGRNSIASKHCFDEAVRLYAEWGAAKKVEMLRETIRDMFGM